MSEDLTDFWKSDGNYGSRLVFEGVVAHISPGMKDGYSCEVRIPGSDITVTTAKLTKRDKAQAWCEHYLRIYVENKRLREKLKLAEVWLNYYRQAYKTVFQKVREDELQAILASLS